MSMRIEDLLHDTSFRSWADGSGTVEARKWDTYTDRHPEHREMLMTAREMVRSQPFNSTPPDPATIERAWARTRGNVDALNRQQKRRRVMRYAAAAAVLLVAALCTFLLNDHKVRQVTLLTAPGEIRVVTLGDGSMVTLNGNSELQYPEAFAGNIRTVRLRGEAFFDVAHIDAATPFIVYTPDARVKVLGTTFNIKSRQAHSIVSLVTGKVEVSDRVYKNPAILLRGQTAELTTGGIRVHADDVSARTSWRDHLWVFNETPLSEVLLSLNETFGVQSRVDPKVNTSKAISGKLSTHDLRTLYKALEAMLQIKISETDDGIRVQNKN